MGGRRAVYLLVCAIGGSLGGLYVLQSAGNGPSRPLGLTVIGLGILTLIWWRDRLRGETTPPVVLRLLAWLILLSSTAAGALALVPRVSSALGQG